uniref:Protein kinase domain-containing protein n=1 Tax=Strongyloides papillosus TaxID=174720 RepID=A0A0N5BEG8_STREA
MVSRFMLLNFIYYFFNNIYLKKINKFTNMVKELPNVSNFRIIRVVGSGTFSTVYEVKERNTGRSLAAKKILTSPDPKCKEFFHEVAALARLKSKYVVEIEYFSRRFKRLFIFTSLHKDNLSSVLKVYKKSKGFLPPNVIKVIMVQLISAVRYCHKKDIIHRDIKPDNILIDKNFKLRLADFGCSLDIRRRPIVNIKFSTTYEYSAPELDLNVGLDSISQDIWSIGCVYAELLTNKQIFPNTNLPEPRFISIYKIVGLPYMEKEIIEKLMPYNIDLNTSFPTTLGKLCGYKENSKEIKLLKFFLNPNYSSRMNLRDALIYDVLASKST